MRFLLFPVFLLALAACEPSDTQNPASEAAPQHEALVPEAPATEKPAPAPDAEGAQCGGIAGVTCPASLYCKQPEGQCLEIMDGSGTCEPVPDVCTQEYAPVCGCDGQTYSNTCAAAAAGASVAAQGECAGADVE